MQDSTGYKLNTIAVVLLGAGILGYVGLRIAFPKYSYSSDRADEYKIQVKSEQLGGRNYLAVTPLHDYPYHKVKLTLKSKRGFEQIPTVIDVFRDFMAQSYPIGEPVTTPEQLRRHLFFNNGTGLPNGTLIRDDNAVYFISKGQRRPFLGPEIFVRLNFDWNRVATENGRSVAALPEGDKIDFVSAHPDGTILKTEQGKLFLVWDRERLPIPSEELLSEVWDDYYTVAVGSEKAAFGGTCNVANQSGEIIRCFFEPAVGSGSSTGQTYLFNLPKGVSDSISNARIVFDMLGRYEVTVAKESLKQIKDDLYLKYADYIL